MLERPNFPELSRAQELILLSLQQLPLSIAEIHKLIDTQADRHGFVWKSDTGTERAVRTLASKHLIKPIANPADPTGRPVYALTKRGRQWLIANRAFRAAVVQWQEANQVG